MTSYRRRCASSRRIDVNTTSFLRHVRVGLSLKTIPGPGCSKLTTSLVNVSLKFQPLISEICQYFLLKKCEKLLQCKCFSHFVNKNISVFGY